MSLLHQDRPPFSRSQFCQTLDTAITSSGDLYSVDLTLDEAQKANVVNLALQWNLFRVVDELATSMSSEDHEIVIGILRSIAKLYEKGLFGEKEYDFDLLDTDSPLGHAVCHCIPITN